jgi:hypothetical protein
LPSGTLFAAVLAVACFATPPAHAVPMLSAGLPDATFVPAGGFPLQNLASICQVTETYPGGAARPSDFSMMDTATPSTATLASGTAAIAGAITLFTNLQAQANYTGPWDENVSPTVTLSGTLTPRLGGATLGAGQLDWQVDNPDNALIPGPGSVFLALGVVATVAAFRLHDGFRGWPTSKKWSAVHRVAAAG